jgi:hypothetical protein
MKAFDDHSMAIVAGQVDFCMANIEHPDCTLDLAGRFYEEMSASQRGLAILYLLQHADTGGYCAELCISAQARLHYLARCAKAGYRDGYAACSRSEPFFDALAARHPALARDIAALSPQDWIEGAEYEDDHCYARFLHRWVIGGATRAELDALITRFEKALEGAPSARLSLCKSLLNRDQEAFDVAFMDLLQERNAEIELEKCGVAAEDTAAAACTYLFIEGLGILFVAEGAGLRTLREYPLCPALARLPADEPPPADPFPPP